MVGGDHAEPHPGGLDRPSHRLDERELDALHVHMEHFDRGTTGPRQQGVHVEALDRWGNRLLHASDRRSAHERADEVGLAIVEGEIAPAQLEMGGIGLDADGPGARDGAEIPVRVVGPVGAQLHHERPRTHVPEKVVEQQFLLRLVVAVEAADQVGHPAAAISVGNDPRALVHDLHPLPTLLDHLARIRDLRDPIRIAARQSHSHAAADFRREVPVGIGLEALPHDEADRRRRIAPEIKPQVPVLAVGSRVDVTIKLPRAHRQVERLHVVPLIAERRDDPLDVLEPEDHARAVMHRGIV